MYFSIGMDTEMVAASLEVAHEQVISKLPTYPTHMPIGWRFMDKFIQLPISIPPVYDMQNYIHYLFSINQTKTISFYQ